MTEQKIRKEGENKMTVDEMAQQLHLSCIAGKGGLQKEVTGVYMGDLLSLAMAHAKEGNLWITVQGHINAIAVAVLVNMPAIILVQGIQASEEMLQKAEEEDIALLATTEGAYEVAKALSRWL